MIANPTRWTAWHGRLPAMIDRLRHAGAAASLNTDDPVLLGASLEGEYALCGQAFGWTDDDIRGVARNSIDASFANAEVKAKLVAALASW